MSSAILPEQRAYKTQSGIGVYVSGDEIFKINKWLYENEQILFAQVHSHPTHAYHSETDNQFPLVTAIGQFSIVVPFFARKHKINLLDCAIFRLNKNNKWEKLKNDYVRSLFKVVE